ncbi:MAG: hypothetical protein DRG78_00125 [Epsilonproteobacteria bacterium]|nr:MAG: hypothetical protein DRG78_00125 [Campylobacterota bacterium]
MSIDTTNSIIVYNKFPYLVWGRGYRKGATVDNVVNPTRITTDVVKDISLKKVKPFEIIFVKYFLPILMIYFLGNISGHYHSQLGFGLGGMIYLFGVFIKERYSYQTMITVISIIPISYLFFGFTRFDLSSSYGVGMILNYMIQYIIIFWTLDNIWADVRLMTWKKYYKVDSLLFRYILIYKKVKNKNIQDYSPYNLKIDTSEQKTKLNNIKKSGLKYLIFIASLFMLFVGGVNITHKIVFDNEAKKIAAAKMKKTRGTISKVYSTNKIKALDSEALELEIDNEKWVHHKISRVERYFKITIVKNTKYKKVFIDIENDGIISRDNKVLVYSKSKKLFINAFYRDDKWYFFQGDNIYLVIVE